MPPTLSVLKHGLCLGGAGIGDNHFVWGPAVCQDILDTTVKMGS